MRTIDPKTFAVIENFRLMDDTFMTCVFEDNIPGVTLLLHTFLERDDLSVREVTAQKKYTNLLGHSAWLDIVAVDKEGKAYDIEVQRSPGGSGPQRARYYSGLLDSRLLEKGQDYSELKDSYVIFITETDVLAGGHPLYHIHRMVEETSAQFGDGSHILYVNGEYQDMSTPLGRLMHDFHCKTADEMVNPILAERVHYLKNDEGGQQTMCQLIEDLNKEAIRTKMEQVTKELLGLGLLPYEKIAELCDLTIEEVKALDNQRTA